jgi:transposase-like protein
MTKKTSNRYSPEVQERAVRMVLEHGSDHASQWAAIASIASKIGCTGETLRKWVRQAERSTAAEIENRLRKRRGPGVATASHPKFCAETRDEAPRLRLNAAGYSVAPRRSRDRWDKEGGRCDAKGRPSLR